MADWLGYGLDEKYADDPGIAVERTRQRAARILQLLSRGWERGRRNQ
jgi:hypothetical protein